MNRWQQDSRAWQLLDAPTVSVGHEIDYPDVDATDPEWRTLKRALATRGLGLRDYGEGYRVERMKYEDLHDALRPIDEDVQP
jgi:hypothetical protein